MSEHNDTNQGPELPDDINPDVIEDGFGEAAPDSPRRSASAEFIVTSEIGAATALRDAMDPANQSLAEALRLSFRVLQIVILILIVLFLGSGIITVKDKQSGVLTRWGKIVPYHGSTTLDSGLKYSWWPYPVSEFVLFDVENRTVDISDTFLMNGKIRGNTIQQQIEKTTTNDRYRDGVDGMLLTADGDIAHVAVSVNYLIEDPVRFIENVSMDQADNIVRWATERAVINAVAVTTLENLMEITEDVRQRIQENAQRSLDDIGCGIRIRQVTLPEPPRPPYAILNTFVELQEAGVQGEQRLQEAKNDAEKIRNSTAGQNWRDIVNLIEQYKQAEELEQTEEAQNYLASINNWLDTKAEGQASSIISGARSYRSLIDSTMGNEAKRFASLLPAYRENPGLVIGERWMNAKAAILQQPDAETFFVPAGMGRMNIGISGLDEIAQIRRDQKLNRQNEAGWIQGLDLENPYQLQAEDIKSGPGRLLNVEGGQVTGQGADSNSKEDN